MLKVFIIEEPSLYVPDVQGKGGPGQDLDGAAALGDAMLLCTAIPWALCALLYSGLHITYRRDKIAAAAYQRARSGFVSAVLPAINEEKEQEAAHQEAALSAMGSARMPLLPGTIPSQRTPGTQIGRLGRLFSRSV